ncbi:hypothetical protein G3R49_04545 [Shewanella sp. WXL01]|uniref:hypothetical protein n=1 Tax=Shewanella sp. WXL01 TaxID=2709721 RepID=UPI00143825D0|nr:hypothetical protein [Shewanella sp. WXL01]NKF49840.1 hypothetical protein [Shewanella sp. WXL01]
MQSIVRVFCIFLVVVSGTVISQTYLVKGPNYAQEIKTLAGQEVMVSRSDSFTVMLMPIKELLAAGKPVRLALAITNHTKERIILSANSVSIHDRKSELGLLSFEQLMDSYKQDPESGQLALSALNSLKMRSLFVTNQADLILGFSLAEQDSVLVDKPNIDALSGATKKQAANSAKVREQAKKLYAWNTRKTKAALTITPATNFIAELHSQAMLLGDSDAKLTVSLNIADEKHQFSFSPKRD